MTVKNQSVVIALVITMLTVVRSGDFSSVMSMYDCRSKKKICDYKNQGYHNCWIIHRDNNMQYWPQWVELAALPP